jgi:hypothetical protein
MGAGTALLDPADVHVGRVEVDLIPTKVNQLAGTEAMTEGDQNLGRVSVPPAVGLGCLDQALDLGLGEVFYSGSPTSASIYHMLIRQYTSSL